MASSKKNKYSIEEKLSILEEAKGKSLHSIAKKYGIDRKSIRDWSNQEEQLKEQLNYKKYRITGGGAKSQLSKENELDIVNWIIQTRKIELPVTSTLVMKYILKIAPELKDKTNKALICLTYRLLQKYNFVLRRVSHIGQRLPLDYENKITVFLKDTISKRKELNIEEKNLHLLLNTDEIPVFFDAPFDSTIDQKGKKDIKIQTAGYEKERISVILACNAIGEKIPPLVIFKGVPGKRIEKDL